MIQSSGLDTSRKERAVLLDQRGVLENEYYYGLESGRLPVKLVYGEEYDRISDAYSREKQVQNWSRVKREALINGNYEMLPLLARKRFEKKEKS